jgi:hypothetical protein
MHVYVITFYNRDNDRFFAHRDAYRDAEESASACCEISRDHRTSAFVTDVISGTRIATYENGCAIMRHPDFLRYASSVPQKSYADALTDAFAGNGTFQRAFTSADNDVYPDRAEDIRDFLRDATEDEIAERIADRAEDKIRARFARIAEDMTEDIAEEIADNAEDIVREKIDTIADEIADIARSIIAEDAQSSRIYRVPSTEEIADAEDRTEIREYYANVNAEIRAMNADNARYYRTIAEDIAEDARDGSQDATTYLRTTEDIARIRTMCADIAIMTEDAEIPADALRTIRNRIAEIHCDVNGGTWNRSWGNVRRCADVICRTLRDARPVRASLADRVQYVCDVCTQRLRDAEDAYLRR